MADLTNIQESTYPEPVFQKDDGSWWHMDETWADEHGPFSSKDAAKAALHEYVQSLESSSGETE
jgi:hypothetical protein